MSADIPEVMPVAWDGTAEGLRVAVCGLDELGLPMARRSISTKLPTDPSEYAAFADAIATTTHKTVMHILKTRSGAEL